MLVSASDGFVVHFVRKDYSAIHMSNGILDQRTTDPQIEIPFCLLNKS